MIEITEHPNLNAVIFSTSFQEDLGTMKTPSAVLKGFAVDFDAPVRRSEEIRSEMRNLIRHNGYKPTGRAKPSPEYLVRASNEEILSSINLAVDICNVVSLHSGLGISVIDFDKATPPLSIRCAEAETEYIFNPSGQVMNISGLLCLWDSLGPCANCVKDSQRTKTHEKSKNTLTVIWGLDSQRTHTNASYQWYVDLLETNGGTVELFHAPNI